MHRDRISGLPCHIIDNILKDLSLRDAVRTSILSKEWRYKWATVPHLVFDWELSASLGAKWPPNFFISHILLMHRGPIVKFSLNCGFFNCHLPIDQWLHFLSNHPIEDLTLRSPPGSVLPHRIFTFNHLKQLQLDFVNIKLPPTFKGFNGLVKLTIVCVTIAPEELQIFISTCPMLEFLHIKKYRHLGTCTYLDIDAPKLRHLHLALFGIKPHTIFKGFSWLATLDIANVFMSPEELDTLISKCPMLEFLCVLENIDSGHSNPVWCLDIDAPNLKHLSLGNVDVKLPTTFRGFSRLVKLSFVNLCIAPEEVQEFVSKCPMLEFLCIDKCNDPCTLWRINIDAPNLKVLNLTGLFSSICLKTARVEKLVVDYHNCNSDNNFVSNFEFPEPNEVGSNLMKFFGLPPCLRKSVGDFEFPEPDEGGSNLIKFFGRLP